MNLFFDFVLENVSLPNKGIASDTCGNVSATKLRNTVSERRIVTPGKIVEKFS
jgi:hypothetical protein